MFEFLFKRPGDGKPGGEPDAKVGAAPDGTESSVSATATRRALQAERLSQLGGDEAAAVDFILQCEFSELRLAAADFVRSPDALARVHTAMRNTDRRVAKLVHGRLEAHRHHEAEHGRAEALIKSAQAMLNDAQLSPNHVADLDRKWAVIAAPQLADAFREVRGALGRRLEAQVALQRAMIDRLAALRRLASDNLPAAELAARVGELAAEQAQALEAPEQSSLPRALAAEVGVELQKLQARLQGLEAGQAALAARAAFLDAQSGRPPAELHAEALRREWKALPALPQDEAGAAVQARFDALLASLPQPEARRPKEARAPRAGGLKSGDMQDGAAQDSAAQAGAAQAGAAQEGAAQEGAAQQASAPDGIAPDARAPADRNRRKGADQGFLDMMDAMEGALLQGSLGTAADIDKRLKETRDRDAREKGMRLTPAQSDRLTHLRAELKRLSDWARWGGNVSREELIRTVETLATQNVPMSELAKKVGSMRDRWKALDSLSGPAPKSLWDRFDAACTTAYAPAAAHFRHLADERHANAERAAKIVEEAQAEIARLQDGSADWKHVAGTVQRLRLAWSHLGAIDRKDKKRLDMQFTDALNTLQAPLEQQRKGEMAEREAIIEEAAAINPHDRHALDTLRALQARWQEHARALPLERKSEQALWQRFRAICDDVFNRRKETMHEADIERRAHEAAKEAISARLEAAAPTVTTADVGRLLRDAAHEWQAIGPVPRAHEARVEKRYHAAVALVQQHAEGARRTAGQAQAVMLRDKLRLVQDAERAVAEPEHAVPADELEARWGVLPALDAAVDAALRTRFDAALHALGAGADAQRTHAGLLERNRALVLQELLRLEIGAGIDSGPEFARDRLKLQVEVLQSSLQAGTRTNSRSGNAHAAADTPSGRLRALLARPALLDDRTATRIEQLFARLARESA
jgi:hypothetical protein